VLRCENRNAKGFPRRLPKASLGLCCLSAHTKGSTEGTRRQMNHRERFQALMNSRPVDRLPVIEWASWWDQTLDRWHGEGLPENGDKFAFLGLDPHRQLWIGAHAPGCPAPARHGAGILPDLSLPAYEEFKRKHLFPKPALNLDAFTGWSEAHARGEFIFWGTLEGFFWFPRTLLGIEPHLYAFYDHPELMHRINADLVEYHLLALEQLCRISTPEFITFAEDLSYNHGPMLSKECFDEFLAPYYRRIIPELKKRGIRAIVDSDGDVTTVIPWFQSVGIEGILPLERRAGIDVAEIRRRHPRWLMIGAFDKTVMSSGEAAMRAEFERLLPVMRQGGFLPCVDHQTPPDVSLAQYRVYVRLLGEYAVKGAPR